jgi:ferric-dicitrate binding protein FerR (iron transport regulator)
LSGDVTVIHADGTREPLTPSVTLKRGDQLDTGIDSRVTLRFVDGSMMPIGEMTQLYMDDLAVQGSRQNVAIAIKLGEVSAQVNPKKAYQTDFKVSTPSGTTSSRGTKFSVFYNASTKTTIVRTTEHSVSFAPSRKGAKTVIVPAGREILVTPTSVSALAPIGKAGARGGVDMQKAVDLVLALLDREGSACKLVAAGGSVSVRPGTSSAWTVTVTVPGQSTSTWSVVSGKVKPLNARAKAIAAGCTG